MNLILLLPGMVAFAMAFGTPLDSDDFNPSSVLVSHGASSSSISMPVHFSMAAPSSVQQPTPEIQAHVGDSVTSSPAAEDVWEVSSDESRAISSRAFKKKKGHKSRRPLYRPGTEYKTLPDEVLQSDSSSHAEFVQALEFEANEYRPSSKYPQSIVPYSHNYMQKEQQSHHHSPQSDYLASASNSQPTLYDSLKSQHSHGNMPSDQYQDSHIPVQALPGHGQFYSNQPQYQQTQEQLQPNQPQYTQSQQHFPPNEPQYTQSHQQSPPSALHYTQNQHQLPPNEPQYTQNQHQSPPSGPQYTQSHQHFPPNGPQYTQNHHQFPPNQPQFLHQHQLPQNSNQPPADSQPPYEVFPASSHGTQHQQFPTQPAQVQHHQPSYANVYQNGPAAPTHYRSQSQHPQIQQEYQPTIHSHPPSPPAIPYPQQPQHYPVPTSPHQPFHVQPHSVPTRTHHGPLSHPPYPHHAPPPHSYDPDPELTAELKELQQLDKEYHESERWGSGRNVFRLIVPLLMLGISIPALGYMWTMMGRRREFRSDNTGFSVQKENVEYFADMFRSAMKCYERSDKCTESN